MIRHARIFITILLFGFASSIGSASAKAWPKIKPANTSLIIDFRRPYELVTIPIYAKNKTVLYRLVCMVGNQENMPVIGTGGLLCGLGEGWFSNEETLGHKTLLSDESPHWYSRGNFNPEEVVGACADYPDYGRLRDFRLRGFRLRIELSDIEISPDYKGGSDWRTGFDFDSGRRDDYPLGAARLGATVLSDSKATRSKAAKTTFKDPKGDQVTCAKR